MGFTLTVTPRNRDGQGHAILVNRDGERVSATTLTMTYRTIVDDADLEEGDEWTIANRATAGGHTADASYTHRKEKPFTKMTGTRPDWGGTVSYKDADAAVDYDASKGILYYQLLVRTDRTTSGDIIVTDTLPDGATLVTDGKNAPHALFWHNEYWTTTSISAWDHGVERRYDLTDGTTFSYRLTGGSGEDGGTVRFTLKDGYNLDGNTNIIAIRYAIDVTGDPAWDDASQSSHTYRNHAEWGSHSDETSTEVNRETAPLSKQGEQLAGADGKPTNRVRYVIDINPTGADLDPNDDTLTLTDVMGGIPASGGAYLDMASLGLYEYGRDAQGKPLTSVPIDTSRYTVRYDQTSHTLTVRLPDGLACTLVYEYVVDSGNVERPQLSNRADLDGQTSSNSVIKIETSSSSAAVWRGRLTVYKVDADNYAKTLPGARFSLAAYERGEDGTYRWGDPVTVTTGKDGTLTLMIVNQTSASPVCVADDEDKDGDGDGVVRHCELRSDTLYRLRETKAPDGYAKDDAPHYLIWKSVTAGSALSDDEAYRRATGGDDAVADGMASVGKGDVDFHRANGDDPLYVENRYSRIEVHKSWVDESGHTVAAPQTGVTAQLYRVRTKANGHRVDVTLVAQGVPESQYSVKASMLVKPGSDLNVLISGSWSGVTYEGISYAPDYANGGLVTVPLGAMDADRQVTLTLNDPWDRGGTITFDGTAADEYVADGDPEPYGDPVELNAGNDWSAVWDALPRADADGDPYRYSVRELDSGYQVAYVNNDGVTTGVIGIINTVTGTTLPEAGGPGTAALTVAGGVATVAAAGAMGVRRSRRRRTRR